MFGAGFGRSAVAVLFVSVGLVRFAVGFGRCGGFVNLGFWVAFSGGSGH